MSDHGFCADNFLSLSWAFFFFSRILLHKSCKALVIARPEILPWQRNIWHLCLPVEGSLATKAKSLGTKRNRKVLKRPHQEMPIHFCRLHLQCGLVEKNRSGWPKSTDHKVGLKHYKQLNKLYLWSSLPTPHTLILEIGWTNKVSFVRGSTSFRASPSNKSLISFPWNKNHIIT